MLRTHRLPLSIASLLLLGLSGWVRRAMEAERGRFTFPTDGAVVKDCIIPSHEVTGPPLTARILSRYLTMRATLVADNNPEWSMAIIVSNTSCLSISSLSRSLRRPERFCGLHFCHPLDKHRLAEVVPVYQPQQSAFAAHS